MPPGEHPRPLPRQLPPPPPDEPERWSTLQRLIVGLVAFLGVASVLLVATGIPLKAIGGNALLVAPALMLLLLVKGER